MAGLVQLHLFQEVLLHTPVAVEVLATGLVVVEVQVVAVLGKLEPQVELLAQLTQAAAVVGQETIPMELALLAAQAALA